MARLVEILISRCALERSWRSTRRELSFLLNQIDDHERPHPNERKYKVTSGGYRTLARSLHGIWTRPRLVQPIVATATPYVDARGRAASGRGGGGKTPPGKPCPSSSRKAAWPLMVMPSNRRIGPGPGRPIAQRKLKASSSDQVRAVVAFVAEMG